VLTGWRRTDADTLLIATDGDGGEILSQTA